MGQQTLHLDIKSGTTLDALMALRDRISGNPEKATIALTVEEDTTDLVLAATAQMLLAAVKTDSLTPANLNQILDETPLLTKTFARAGISAASVDAIASGQ